MLCDLTLLNPPFGLRLTFPDMARLQLKTVPPSALSTPHNDRLHHGHHEHYRAHSHQNHRPQQQRFFNALIPESFGINRSEDNISIKVKYIFHLTQPC